MALSSLKIIFQLNPSYLFLMVWIGGFSQSERGPPWFIEPKSLLGRKLVFTVCSCDLNRVYLTTQSHQQETLISKRVRVTLIRWCAALYAPVPFSFSPGACSPVSYPSTATDYRTDRDTRFTRRLRTQSAPSFFRTTYPRIVERHPVFDSVSKALKAQTGKVIKVVHHADVLPAAILLLQHLSGDDSHVVKAHAQPASGKPKVPITCGRSQWYKVTMGVILLSRSLSIRSL